MFRLTVRDRVMIAHSFQGEVFGPAQGVHGATYVVETEFRSKTLDEHNLVVDIGLAHVALAKTLQQLNYKNLDELPDLNELSGRSRESTRIQTATRRPLVHRLQL